MSLVMPGAPTDFPGVERFDGGPYFAVSGPSPRTWTIQLPEFGVWMLYFWAYYSNQNFSIDAVAHVSWFRYSVAASAQQKNLGNTRQIGDGEPAAEPIPASGSANRWTGLSISDPSATGEITVTGTFSGAGDLTPILKVSGHKLIRAPFFI